MPTELFYPTILLCALVVVLILTPIVKTVGLNNGLFDEPDERKVHSKPMVRLGGIAIFAGTMTAIALGFTVGGFTFTGNESLVALLLGAIAFFTIDAGSHFDAQSLFFATLSQTWRQNYSQTIVF